MSHSPPSVSFPTSPYITTYVSVTLASGSTTWEYSINGGLTWTQNTVESYRILNWFGNVIGVNLNLSVRFLLPAGTYSPGSIQVRNTKNGVTSASTSNSREKIIFTWSRLGGDIDGESGHDFSGFSVSLSSDGKPN